MVTEFLNKGINKSSLAKKMNLLLFADYDITS
jgi:hypothetical protein